MTAVHALADGTRVGRYVVRAKLGAGGMGVVYRAQDADSGREVALKMLPGVEPASLYRFKREFRALAEISHPNVVSLHELAADGDNWFFTMELVHGSDLLTWARAGPPDTDPSYFVRLRRGLRQLALGLRAIHGNGKVHCDLKPSNVLVTHDDRVVILDFGLARDRPRHDADSSAELLGTALYMAPEQARSSRVGAAADWYAVGIMLYELLTGAKPFTGTQTEILLAKQQREPQPPRTLVPAVPRDLDDLCVALLRRAPAARPGSTETLELLGVTLDGESGEPRVDTATNLLGTSFVGRSEELAILRRCYESSRTETVAALVRGESGVGKTALVRQFLEAVRAARSDAVVLAGRCYQRESVPYRALDAVVDALSDHLRRLNQIDVALATPADVGLLPRVFPVMGRVAAIARAQTPRAGTGDPQALRNRAFTALRELLRMVAEQAPVVIFVDDLQWADSDGLAAIAEVLHAPDAPRLLLVATVRSDPAGTMPSHLLPVMDAIEQAVDLPVGPLPREDAVELAELVFERLGAEGAVDPRAIADDAGGHPLFIDELVRYKAAATAGAGPASRLEDALWARIDRVEADGRALLEVLSLAEVPLRTPIACRAAGVDVATIGRRVERLAADHLVRISPAADGTDLLEPYHDRVRETLAARVPAQARVDIHRRLADALQEAGASVDDPQALVQHLIAAGETARAAAQALEAGRRADAALAFDLAVEMYRVALEHGDHDPDDELALRRQLVDTMINAGRGVEAADELMVIFEGASDGAVRIDCQRRAAEQLLLNGHLERGLAILDAVADEIGVRIPATTRRAVVSLLWSRVKLWLRRTRWKRRDESEIPARALTEADVQHSLASILALVDPVRGQALQARSVLISLKLGERDRVVRALSTEAAASAAIGNQRRAEDLIVRAMLLAEEIGDPSVIAWARGIEAVIAFVCGRFREAVPLLDGAIGLYEAMPARRRGRLTTGGAYEANVMRAQRALALAYLGECRRSRRAYHELVRDATRRGDRFQLFSVTGALNIAWLFDDDPARARLELAANTWPAPEGTIHVQHFLRLRATAQIHLYCGTVDEGLEELGPAIAAVDGSLLLRVQMLGAEHLWMNGRLALAESKRDDKGRLKSAAAAARKLGKIQMEQSQAAAHLLRAGIAHQQSDDLQAVAELARAEAIAGGAGLQLMAAAARRRRGQLLGGPQGTVLVSAVDRWLASEGVANPERLTRMYAPGFDRR